VCAGKTHEYRSTFDGVPPARAGMRIGLLGGSFNPPHAGHLHISLEALKRLRLDAVWWLVSPGNPLKANGPRPLAERLTQCLALADYPRIKISALEAQLGSPYTADTLAHLQRRFPGVRFVWLMGGDNLAEFHRWRRWRQIFDRVPVAILDRPETRLPALASRAAHVYSGQRLPERAARRLASRMPPAWLLLTIPLHGESSTRIRGEGK
jgi:nicotinate-nucleotide adenylyltransferase